MEDSQMIHEIIMIMNNNQYSGGVDSNKSTVIQMGDLLQAEYGLDEIKFKDNISKKKQ